MDIVAVNNNQFTHYPKRIPKGTVNAELVQLRLDKEWEGLTVFWHWRNMGTKAEIREELPDPTEPRKIPWEVLTDLGDLEIGLVGMDGETTVKPTIWLTYGYVVDGVDPDIGDDPQPPTPNYLEQMVAQATQANQAAQAAQQATEEAAEAVASAGPYAEEAKKSAEAAKASQEAAATSAQKADQAAKDAQAAAGSIGNAVEQAQSAATAAGSAQRAAETAQTAAAQSADAAQTHAGTASQSAQDAQSAATQAGQYLASVEADAQAAATAATAAGESKEAAQVAAQTAANARDQANTAATTAQDHATAADAAKTAAEQAAGNAASAKAEAAQSAQDAAGSASAAQAAKEAAEAAASILPAPTPEDAGKPVVVNPEGNGYIFGEASGGSAKRILHYIHTANKKVQPESVELSTGIFTTSNPHGLANDDKLMLVINYELQYNVTWIPFELFSAAPVYQYNCVFADVVSETQFRLKPYNKDGFLTFTSEKNTSVDVTKFAFELLGPTKLTFNSVPVIHGRQALVIISQKNGLDVSQDAGFSVLSNSKKFSQNFYGKNDSKNVASFPWMDYYVTSGQYNASNIGNKLIHPYEYSAAKVTIGDNSTEALVQWYRSGMMSGTPDKVYKSNWNCSINSSISVQVCDEGASDGVRFTNSFSFVTGDNRCIGNGFTVDVYDMGVLA